VAGAKHPVGAAVLEDAIVFEGFAAQVHVLGKTRDRSASFGSVPDTVTCASASPGAMVKVVARQLQRQHALSRRRLGKHQRHFVRSIAAWAFGVVVNFSTGRNRP